jgi:hypothetical protein
LAISNPKKNSGLFTLGLKIEENTPMVMEHISSIYNFNIRGDIAQKHGSVFVDFQISIKLKDSGFKMGANPA